MRVPIAGVMSCAAAALAAVADASSLSVQSATSSVATSQCADACNALQGDCMLLCETFTNDVGEFADVSVMITPVTILTSGTVDAQTFGGRTPATASAVFDVQFTLSEATYVYATWNIFFPPAQNNFLPASLPADGVFLGELAAGSYFIGDTLAALGEQTKSSGLLLRIIPDITADCDGNGVKDWEELVVGTQTDADNDGVPDECPQPVFGDLDGDGLVGGPDLAVLLGQWAGSGIADLDGDGHVGAPDLALLLGAWS
jgi:hypothetical protein